MDDLNEKKIYCNLKQEELDCSERGYGIVVKQTTA